MTFQKEPMRVIDHKKMRRIIGGIAFLLPIVVVLLSGREGLSSISISYWTDSRDIFVGALVAVGFYLGAYNGPGRCGRLEKRISWVAGVCAICIAIFPTTGFDPEKDIPAQWLLVLTSWTPWEPVELHQLTAFLLFFCLFLMLVIFSCRASRKGKELRSRIYLGLSFGMSIGLFILYLILEKGLDRYNTIFFVEFAGLLLFGIGWYIAGKYQTEDLEIPNGAKLLTQQPIEVDPRNTDVSTGIMFDDIKGEQLIFVAEGCWKDWFIRCGPEGWGPKWSRVTRKNRLQGQPIFALCGSIGKSDVESLNFYIGNKRLWSVPNEVDDPDDCELYLYANDRNWAYWNNKELKPDLGGPMKVTIYRV